MSQIEKSISVYVVDPGPTDKSEQKQKKGSLVVVVQDGRRVILYPLDNRRLRKGIRRGGGEAFNVLSNR